MGTEKSEDEHDDHGIDGTCDGNQYIAAVFDK